MTKVAAISLGLIAIVATSVTAPAQSAPTSSAINEAVRREHNLRILREKLSEAREAFARKDVEKAAAYYSRAHELALSIGQANAKAEYAEALKGLSSTSIELAARARKYGDLVEAKKRIDVVLTADPKNPEALALQKAIAKETAESKGLRPKVEDIERVQQARVEKADANELVQGGKILLDAGKLEEAEAKLNEALKKDPQNQAAFFYLNLVNEQKYRSSDRSRELASRKSVVTVENEWTPPNKRDGLPKPNPYNRSELIHTGKGRQQIVAKLDLIRFDSASYDGLPLSEVVRLLSDEAKKRDPEKKGVNFIVNPNSAAASAGAPVLDPATGQLIAPPPAEPVDVGAIQIKLNPPLADVRLADVLDAVVKVADKPLKYSIEDYAVVFSVKGSEPVQLFTRTFRVDPNTFQQGLEGVGGIIFGDFSTSSGGGGGGGGGRSGGGGGQGGQGSGSTLTIPRVEVSGAISSGGGGGGGGGRGGGGGGGGGGQGGGLSKITVTNAMEAVHSAVRNFFVTMGVNLDPALGKTVFFNDRQGTLFVRATMDELDIIEQAVQALNIAPPLVNIKAKFLEVTQDDNRALGFDWYLGNFLMGNNRIGAQAGTAASSPSPFTTANPGGAFPGYPGDAVNAATTIAPAATDSLLTGGLRNPLNAPALATVTGILTDPQFRVVLKALDQRQGVDLLSSPEVTTMSGRQAQVQVSDIRTIVTGLTQDTQNQNTGTAGNGTVVQAASPITQNFDSQAFPLGPVLDVIPYVSADGYTIQMTIIPTITEFVGYDDPGQFVPAAITSQGSSVVSVLPLPRFRVRQVTTSVIVWDGQTVVLGGLITEDMTRLKDKVPVLGDLPGVGKLFRSEQTQTRKKNLMIFVTPTIIDPSGNRAHSEEEMPFAQTSIPSQAASTQK